MPQSAFAQRLKNLMEALHLDARTFSQKMDVAETTTRNYLNRGTKPGADYLEKIGNAFPTVNLHWLLTGKGDPTQADSSESLINYQKNISGNNIGTNHGKATQQHGATGPTSSEQILLVEIAHLKQQLAMKDQLLKAKDETIDLLKAAYGRPN